MISIPFSDIGAVVETQTLRRASHAGNLDVPNLAAYTALYQNSAIIPKRPCQRQGRILN